MASPVISVRPATMFFVDCEECGVLGGHATQESAEEMQRTHYRVHRVLQNELSEEVDSGDEV